MVVPTQYSLKELHGCRQENVLGRGLGQSFRCPSAYPRQGKEMRAWQTLISVVQSESVKDWISVEGWFNEADFDKFTV